MSADIHTTTNNLVRTVFREASGFEALRSEWNGLLARSRFNSLFLTWDWQTTWWHTLGSGDLRIVAWRDAEGSLVGLAPLYRQQEEEGYTWHLVGCIEVADYLDLIVAVDWERPVYEDFLAFLGEEDAQPWDRVSLCNLYQPSQTYTLLPELARARGFAVEVAREDVAPYLELPETFDAYLESLPKKQRHEIRRKRRKLDRESRHWRWFQIGGGDELDRWVEEFIRLHRMASSDKEAFMSDDMARFFHRIAEMAAGNSWLQLAFIEINGTLASTMFNFHFDDRIWVYNSGYDPDAYGALSPGIVLTSYLIEDAIEKGVRIFDFLQGDEIYKYRFGAVDADVMRVTLRRG
ncbi:MAG: GNAT family N-acetyltransferase [Caldilineae bacterium]|nr:MAG: GNAT family N-acetyltransferase [Caldilineae bacterium]